MLTLEDLEIYNLSMELGEDISNIVLKWDCFTKDTVGKQLIRSSDSIAANISEGYGRFSYKENKQFCYYSRGSLMETKTWLVKVKRRKLITNEHSEGLLKDLELIHKKLNGYIKSIGNKQQMTND